MTVFTVSKRGLKVKKHPQAENNCDPYPEWVCGDCAIANGGNWTKGHLATFHDDLCGWCGQIRSVTKPKDYGYPDVS